MAIEAHNSRIFIHKGYGLDSLCILNNQHACRTTYSVIICHRLLYSSICYYNSPLNERDSDRQREGEEKKVA